MEKLQKHYRKRATFPNVKEIINQKTKNWLLTKSAEVGGLNKNK